jgi:exopolysaccharide biosynthesis protein
MIRIVQWTKESDLFFNNTGQIVSGAQSVVFNAWPALLRQGEIQTDIQQNISHRNQEYPRTIIAKDQSWKTFFVLFRKPITLYKATQWIQDKSLYDAINLDGGPSTALTDTAHSSNSFNESEVLPILFCIN